MAGDRAHPARAARRRAYGQNFLRSPRLADALVREAGIRPTDLVLEIGSGSGRLTAALAASGARIRALELDPAWAARLRERFGGRANVEVIEADALAAPLPAESFRAVDNLPFQHTTAILRRLLHDPRLPLVRADVIVQWEVARKRASCWPGTLLNAYWGAWYEFQTVRRLPAACFEPRPAVDAAVLRIVRRSEPLVAVAERAQYLAFLEAGFGRGGQGLMRQRRLKRTARDLGLPPGAGATELDVHQWATLFRAIRRTG